ncbi:alpha/beta hydrolase [Streptomyces tanashiensis]|uniref:alpha/beta hydrolase n=1 Tax=Streptomyces tanashiensis TaxID=67367 RepID=UPI001672954D|nr:alpha/beta hydrolase [Streptomyces tanashiensis]GGT25752.1 alpha/beta hydrolase [Streptomyces tanashiensis]
MRSTRIAPLVAIGAVAALVPALTPAVASADAPAPRRALSTAPFKPYTQQTPHWKRCEAEGPANFQCATLKVPLDYARPGGKKLEVAVSRIKATNPQKRRGVLLLNPGGPGGPGLDMPLWMGPELPTAVKEQYDLIGFDPRGVGQSSPVSCGLNDDELNWQRPYKATTFAKDVRWARTVADKCRAKAGDVLPHLTTRNTARDMDIIRAVLGEKKISYLGYSYGTYLGAVYTQMFPKQSDRFVLDSAVDPQRIWRGMIQVWAEGAEPAFKRWSQWTAERHTTYKLGDTSAKVSKTFWDLVAQADRKPIDFQGTPLTGDDIRAGRAMFFDVKSAAEAIAELKKAADGAPTAAPSKQGTSPRPVPPSFARAVPSDNSDAAFWAVACADTRSWPRDPEQYRRDAMRDKAKYPLYGDFASNIKPCAFWKNGSEAATRVDNSVGALVLQNEWDSQTPLVSGQGLHRSMKGSRMVTVLGGQGHGIYGSKSCADKTATAYLTTGRLPAADVTCRATPAQAQNRLDLPLPTPQGLPQRQDRS